MNEPITIDLDDERHAERLLEAEARLLTLDEDLFRAGWDRIVREVEEPERWDGQS